MIVGHHHHMLRGMEWYRGKPIMYGLGHFVFDLRLQISEELKAALAAVGGGPEGYTVPYVGEDQWPLMPMHPDARMTLFAYAHVEGGKVTQIGFVPCRLQKDGRVLPADPNSPEGAAVVTYMREACLTQRLNANLLIDDHAKFGGYAAVRVMPGAL